MREKIIEFLKTNPVKAFAWQTANGFVLLLVSFLVLIQPDIINPALLLLVSAGIAGGNALTKYINTKHL